MDTLSLKTTSFSMTWFGSFKLTKQRHFIVCHIALFLPCVKSVRFITRFGLSDTIKSIKMKIDIFK